MENLNLFKYFQDARLQPTKFKSFMPVRIIQIQIIQILEWLILR